MRHWFWLAAVAAVSVMGAVAPSKAQRLEQSYPWCSQYFQSSEVRSCAYNTYAQCMESVSGVGGYCFANPGYARQPASQAPLRLR